MAKTATFIQAGKLQKNQSLFKYLLLNKSLYLFLLPGFIYLFIFNYIPMYGVIIAFKEFNIAKGIWDSSWVGLNNFKTLFMSQQFPVVFKNSISFSLLRLICGFPAPILLALILNEVRQERFKRLVQTVTYIPHFVSWVVVCGIVKIVLAPTNEGIITSFVKLLGGTPKNLLISSEWFRLVVILAEIWKEIGWGAIIYLAALAGIDPTLYEAATMDGATRLQRLWFITLPGISSTIAVLLILRAGRILDNGFEQIFLLYSPMVYNVADVFETYSYRVGLLEGRFSYAATIGLFKSFVGLITIYVANYLSKLVGNKSMF